MLERSEQLLQGLNLSEGFGAEIGPLDRPLVPRSAGRVIYVDHCDTETLRARWSSDANVRVDRIEVDAVWGVHTLKQSVQIATGADSALDYVVASHVIEHVPDVIGWLREISDALGKGGSLRLAIPDKRYTFDLLRRTTTMTEVLDAHIRDRRVPSGSRVLDFALNMVEVDCTGAWEGTLRHDQLRHGYTREQAIALARDAEQNGTYHDVHCWVFTPHSFATLMHELSEADLTNFACGLLTSTRTNTIEFFAHLHTVEERSERSLTWSHAVELFQWQAASGSRQRHSV